MLTYQEAKEKLQTHISDKLLLHCREVEVIMRAAARELNEDEEKWGIAGLIHDMDFDIVQQDDINQHGTKIKELLNEDDIPTDSWHAIQAHCHDLTHIEPETPFDYALLASDNISGMIYATALIYPDKKVASVKVSSVRKRMKKKDFARNVNREAIENIEKAGIPLDRFIEIAIKAMSEIADEIGL